MKLEILGCSGGIGAGLRTTSFLVDDEILIDAGTGVGDLSLDRMANIRHIFLTHSHLDHISYIPLLVDSVFDRIKTPIIVHGRKETLKALKDHIFNWITWPDFTQLPSAERGVLDLQEMHPGEIMMLGGRTFEMIDMNHTVPAAGYRVESESGAFAFSGDTTINDGFWEVLNRHSRLDLLIVEVAFPNQEDELASLAKHYCPEHLAEDLKKLKHEPDVVISHLKPGAEKQIMSECYTLFPERKPGRLSVGDSFQL